MCKINVSYQNKRYFDGEDTATNFPPDGLYTCGSKSLKLLDAIFSRTREECNISFCFFYNIFKNIKKYFLKKLNFNKKQDKLLNQKHPVQNYFINLEDINGEVLCTWTAVGFSPF